MRPALALLFLALLSTGTAASERDLDSWFDRTLLPFVTSQLVEHPRFKGESVMFVVFEDNVPASVSNALAISLRDRLLDAALNTPGVIVGRRQGGGRATPTGQAVDCTQDDVHYYVGISVSRRIDGLVAVNVRALDLEDRNWVSGFGKAWRGTLDNVQQRAFRQTRTDSTFRGARDVPFSADESDLLAAYLAHELSCALLRETTGRYVVAADPARDVEDELAATIQLVGNNLASHDALELTADELKVNATLNGKAHRIDGALYQYWLTVTPTDPEAELSTLSTNAYVLLPGQRLAGETPAPDPAKPARIATHANVDIPRGRGDTLLGPLRILRSQDARLCGRASGATTRATAYGASTPRCSVLISDSKADAIVFVLAYQANYGLVRLGGPDCRERTAPHLVSRGTPFRYPVPFTAIGNTEMHETAEWQVAPGVDTYYALAVTDARAARAFANHIDNLPLRCSPALRRGLEGDALHRWLEAFAELTGRHASHAGWRAIEIKDLL